MATYFRGSMSVVLAAALIAQVGCASRAVRPEPLPVPPLASIAALGRTGVTAAWGASNLQMNEPPKGRAAGFGRGAAAGAGATVKGGLVLGSLGVLAGPPGAFWFLGWTAVGVALSPAAAVIGGIVTAVNAQPPEQVERRKAALVDAMTAADLLTTLRDDVIRLGNEQSGHTLVPVGDRKPEGRELGVGSVLELVVRRVALEGEIDPKTGKPKSVWSATDPELQLRLDVDAWLFRKSDGATLYTGEFQASGSVRKFSAWAADDGRDFRHGLAAACEDVARQIASALFPRVALGCDDTSQRCAVGSVWNDMRGECVPCPPAPE